ncbi:hypothetical protein BV20DRAFT_599935 [Pilatotrama ljubarskyi]|nr:hypothetical protein BV20DRAFT_599935 [Pilatotrama ljubarskyi]
MTFHLSAPLARSLTRRLPAQRQPPPLPVPPPTVLAEQTVVAPAQYISPEQMFPAYHQNPASYGIPAEAANLEYSILSAILGGSPDSGSGGSPVTQPVASTSTTGAGAYAPAQSSGLASAAWPAEPYEGSGAQGAQAYAGAGAGGAQGYGDQQQQQPPAPLAIQPSETTLSASSEYIAPGATAGTGTAGYSSGYAPQTSQGPPGQYAEYPPDQSQAQPQAGASTSTSGGGGYPPATAQSPPSSFLSRPRRNPSSPTTARLVPNWSGQSLSTGLAAGMESAVQSVYKSVTKGYDYTEGYHFLMKHLSRRCVRFVSSGV